MSRLEWRRGRVAASFVGHHCPVRYVNRTLRCALAIMNSLADHESISQTELYVTHYTDTDPIKLQSYPSGPSRVGLTVVFDYVVFFLKTGLTSFFYNYFYYKRVYLISRPE